jgi:hypothetical protein
LAGEAVRFADVGGSRFIRADRELFGTPCACAHMLKKCGLERFPIELAES